MGVSGVGDGVGAPRGDGGSTGCPECKVVSTTARECRFAGSQGGALPVIMSITGPRETHDYRELNLELYECRA